MALFVFSVCCVFTIKVLLLLLLSSAAVAAVDGLLAMLVHTLQDGFAPFPLLMPFPSVPLEYEKLLKAGKYSIP